MVIQVIKYQSTEYESMCCLRDEVLRKPIGLRLTEEEKQRDTEDTLIACIREGEVIACCILTEINATSGKLRQMAVGNEYQGQGIGKKVLDYAEFLAKEKGYASLSMHARKVATDFYKKSGYAINGEEFTEVGIPHFEMKKTI